MMRMWIVLSVMLASGCATELYPVHGTTATVQLISNHTALVQGHRSSISNAGRVLKKAGARQNTYVEVRLAGESDAETVKSLRKSLVRSGFPHVSVVARVYVSSDGVISIGSDAIRIAELGRILEGMGAGPATRIEIHGDRNASANTLKEVANRIIMAGYPKVIVARKKAPSVLMNVEE